MIHGNRIFVVAVRDEANGRRALLRALQLVRKGTDGIHLVHARRAPDLQRVAELLQPPWMDGGIQSNRPDERWLEDLATDAREQGHAVICQVLSGAPGTAVSTYARETEADLIVVASPREGLSRELFLGSTALSILRNATCPVLVARNASDRAYRSVLVAIDLNAIAERVMAATGRFFPQARVDLAHAYLVPEEYKLRYRGVSEEAIAELRRSRRPQIEQMLEPLTRLLPQAALHAEHGFPPSVILELFNRLKSDVLVIGKHSGSALDEHVMGSVTQFLLYACDTDFLLVP